MIEVSRGSLFGIVNITLNFKVGKETDMDGPERELKIHCKARPGKCRFGADRSASDK